MAPDFRGILVAVLCGLIKVTFLKKQLLKYTLVFVLVLNLALAKMYGLTPWDFEKALVMLALDHVFAYVYEDDLAHVRKANESYLRGDETVSLPTARWEKLEQQQPGFSLISYNGATGLPDQLPGGRGSARTGPFRLPTIRQTLPARAFTEIPITGNGFQYRRRVPEHAQGLPLGRYTL